VKKIPQHFARNPVFQNEISCLVSMKENQESVATLLQCADLPLDKNIPSWNVQSPLAIAYLVFEYVSTLVLASSCYSQHKPVFSW
jgi:hypothetical protein